MRKIDVDQSRGGARASELRLMRSRAGDTGSRIELKVEGMGGHPRREGGAKPPKTATDREEKRAGSVATVQGTYFNKEKREGCDRAREKVM